MRLPLRLQEYLIASIGYTLLVWHPSWLPVPVLHGTLFFLLAWAAAERITPTTSSFIERLLLGATAWASILSLAFTLAYYGSLSLTRTTMLEIEIIAAALLLLLPFSSTNRDVERQIPTAPLQRLLIGACSLVAVTSLGLLIRTALLHQVTTSIRTPWPLLPNGTFLLFALLFASGLVATRVARSAASSLLATLPWLGISALPALLYPLGYGFDGFIHRASQELLSSTGTLTPKPLYYIGQYVWTVWLSRLTELPLRTIDVWLAPCSIFLVSFALYGLLRRQPSWMRWTPWIFLLCIPLSAFVTTTPQSWSYLLGMSALLFALWPNLQGRLWTLPLLVAAWSVAAHPLGGLPFACIVGALWLGSFTSSRRIQQLWQGLGLAGALFMIPFAFWVQSNIGNTPIQWSWDWLFTLRAQDLLPSLLLSPRQTLTLWIDATEWTRLTLSFATIVLGGWLLLRPQHPHDRVLVGTGLGLLLVRFILEHAVTFSFLISYERGNYTERLGVLSALFLAFPVARWTSYRADLLRARSGLLWTTIALACVGVWCVRVYDALPRHDAAQASSGWSVGRADMDAARWIHDQAGDTRYAVLANQTVSAAALQTYGFARYHGDVFYYPLPTGGPLYQLFLEAASTKASTTTMQQAATLTNSEIVYVVLNDYWWDAERIREHLGQFATRSLSFSEGRVWVYEFPTPSSTTVVSPPTSR